MDKHTNTELMCADCICRTCGHNCCGEGSGCTGCNDCTGEPVKTSEECVNSLGYISDEL